MSGPTAVALAIFLPLAGALGIVLAGRWPNLREGVTLSTAVALFLAVGSLFRPVAGGARPTLDLIEVAPGLPLAFEVEPLGMVFGLVASFLWAVNSLYSIGYMRAKEEHDQTRFYACFAIAISSALGVAFAGNMFTLFVFYEVLTLSTYPLVTHAGTAEALRGGRVYLGILLSTSIGLQLVALVGTWALAGTTAFAEGGILAGTAPAPVLSAVLLLYVFGIGKAAIMPVHRWLPAAMVAPTPVSAFLHAVAVVKAGVFSVVKVLVYIFGFDTLAGLEATDWVVYLAGFTIIAASCVALRADNLKRRLAYSTVSQLSYVIMAAALLAPAAVLGAIVHIAAHAFAKITLFFAAGSIDATAHKKKVSELAGIGRRMPVTMGAFAVGALSMVGVPPLAGFVSKWYMLLGALEGVHIFALAVIVASTILNAAYFLPIVHAAFFRPERAGSDDAKPDHGEARLPIVAALSVTAAMTVAFFLYPDWALSLARQIVPEAP